MNTTEARLGTLETKVSSSEGRIDELEKKQGQFNERFVKLEKVEKSGKSSKKDRAKSTETVTLPPVQSGNGEQILALNDRALAIEGRLKKIEEQQSKVAPPVPAKSPTNLITETRELKLAAKMAFSAYLTSFSQEYLPLWGKFILGVGIFHVIQKATPIALEKVDKLASYIKHINDTYIAQRVQLLADFTNVIRLKLVHPVATIGTITGKITELEWRFVEFVTSRSVTTPIFLAVGLHFIKPELITAKLLEQVMQFASKYGINVIGQTVVESSISHYILLSLTAIGILHTLLAKLATYIPAAKPVEQQTVN